MNPSSSHFARPLRWLPPLLGLGGLLASPPAEAAVFYKTGDIPMQDLDIGPDGDVFAISEGSIAGTNGSIYQWLHGEWVAFSGGGYGKRIASDRHGRPWIVNALDEVWRYTGTAWTMVPSVSARAIDISSNGSEDFIFIIRTNGLVARWNGTSFQNFGGYGLEISVDDQGDPWIVNGLDELWEYTGTAWYHHQGISARDVDAGADGTTYLITGGNGADGNIYRYAPFQSTWIHNGGYGTRITVAPTGAPAIVNSAGSVWSNFKKRIHGDASCASWETDCNVCAFDVRGQFAAMFAHGHRTHENLTWRLTWDWSYPPVNLTPAAAFDDGAAAPSPKHVQGFVATGSIDYPYAGSYSDDHRGSVFVIRRYAPNPRLAYIHGTDFRGSLGFDEHPSGVHALGHLIGVNEFNDLRIHKLDNPQGALIIYTEPTEVDMGSSGGGLGLARLGPHEYLVASTTPGGTGGGPRSTHFWKIEGAIGMGTHELAYLGGGEHQIPWGANYERSENVSLITECETGQIYAVHTTGDFDIYGDGFWRISRLEQAAGGPVFRALDVYAEGQNAHTCHLRAAASAYTDDSGEIVTYCHEYDARHELGESAEGVDFTRRPPDYTDSCIQSCGGSSAGGMCWCDAACATYGDCCNDVATHCPG